MNLVWVGTLLIVTYSRTVFFFSQEIIKLVFQPSKHLSNPVLKEIKYHKILAHLTLKYQVGPFAVQDSVVLSNTPSGHRL